MLKAMLRTIMALAIFSGLGIFLSACGNSGSIPDDAVATADGTPITKSDYEKWAAITARGSATGGPTVVPDPPMYTRCIAVLRRQARSARGQSAPKDVALRAQCRQQNEALVQQTMGTLIQNVWIEKEAEDQGLSVTDDEIERQLAVVKRQSFPTEKAYKRFLKQSGMTQDDVHERLRTQVLAQKLTADIQGSAHGSTAGQKKLETFVRDFQKRWREKTDCRKGYVVTLCSNGPQPPSPTSSSATPPPTQSAPSAQSGGSASGTGK
jgi:hypothetical protein